MAVKTYRVGHLIIGFAWLLSVVAFTLIMISYLSPYPERHRALITIIPNMTAEQYLASENQTIYAPTVTIGLFGSCVQANSRAFPNCSSTRGGNYSVDILPDNTPKSILRRPHNALRVHIGVSISLLFLNIVSWAAVGYLPFKGKMPFWFAWVLESMIEYMPLLSFFFGLVGFVATHTLYTKTCTDFNNYQVHNPVPAGSFVASTGNGFLLAWLAYGFVFHAMTVFWVAFFKEPKPAAAPATAMPATATPATAAPATAAPATAPAPQPLSVPK